MMSAHAHQFIDVLHDFCESHGLVDTGNGEGEVLHHAAHHAALVG